MFYHQNGPTKSREIAISAAGIAPLVSSVITSFADISTGIMIVIHLQEATGTRIGVRIETYDCHCHVTSLVTSESTDCSATSLL